MNHPELSAQTARLKDILLSEKDFLLTGRAREAAALMSDKMEAMQDLEAFLETRQPQSLPSEHRADMETIVRLSTENSAHFQAICAMPLRDSSHCTAAPMLGHTRRMEVKFLLRKLLVSFEQRHDRLTVSTQCDFKGNCNN